MSNNNGGPPQPTQETLRMWEEQNALNGPPQPTANTLKMWANQNRKKKNAMGPTVNNLSQKYLNQFRREELISSLFAPNKIGGRRRRSTRKSRKSRKNKRSTRSRK
jgi:hypothetical protein